MTITGEPSNGWTPVWYNGTAGYISANLLSAFTTTPQTTTAPVSLAQETAPVAAPLVAADPAVESGSGELAATTLSDVNLRGAPETTAPIMGTIPAGATLTALAGPEQGFYQVQYGQQIGWVSAEFLQVSATYLQRDNRTDSNRQEGKVEGSAPAANAELGAGGIIWPVRGGQWTIMQGYHGSSHQNQDSLFQYEYSLDLARVDGNTAGQPIYSPVNGIVRWTDPSTGGISIDIGNGHAVAMFHVTFTGWARSGHAGAAGTGARRDLRSRRPRIHGHGACAPRALGDERQRQLGPPRGAVHRAVRHQRHGLPRHRRRQHLRGYAIQPVGTESGSRLRS